jgi:hypothetical protein
MAICYQDADRALCGSHFLPTMTVEGDVMNATKFAAIRRRVLQDAMFRGGLRADFERTLAEERLLGDLTHAQLQDLRLTLDLYDALNMPHPRRERAPARISPASALVKVEGRPAAAASDAVRPYPRPVPHEPVDMEHWRTRRAR